MRKIKLPGASQTKSLKAAIQSRWICAPKLKHWELYSKINNLPSPKGLTSSPIFTIEIGFYLHKVKKAKQKSASLKIAKTPKVSTGGIIRSK